MRGFKSDFKLLFLLFLSWKVVTLVIAFIAISFVPLVGKNFLGGGFEKYLTNPFLFAWANFDGEHYLSIAQIGYRGLEQAFFPLYPSLMKILTLPFGANVYSLTISGILISNICFFGSLLTFWKLIRLDFDKKIALFTVITILVFPTSFYFGAVYSESVFLFLSLASFYFARQKRWFLAGVFGMVASTTRIFGIILLPAFLIEAWQQKQPIHKIFWIMFIPLGLLSYMYYQWITVGDPLAFYHLQKIVGPQHESGITLLPQVYVRYVKMFFSVEMSNPIFQTLILEFFIGMLFFLLPIYGIFKKVGLSLRLSYLFYALVGFLLPTIQGSFSSVPRYVIILFPSFLVLAIILHKLPKLLRGLILMLSLAWMFVELTLFLRGYWVA